MLDASPDSNARLAIIGGSGLYSLQETTEQAEAVSVQTPYDAAPVTVFREATSAGPVWFIPRHGRDHSIAPHLINYRANLWALRHAGASGIIAVNAVGGISESMAPGSLVLPDQIIDYTWGREHSYFSDQHALERHVDFTWPYDGQLGSILRETGASLGLELQSGAVYACTQGPRLESAAEIRRLHRDGCDMVGMTGMPEASLARELGLPYACIALVVNKAAGMGEGAITTAGIEANLESGMRAIRTLLLAALPRLVESLR